MLVTQQPILNRFWYPVMPIDRLIQQPQSFELLGQKIALWLDDEQPAAVRDYCCHRSAQLSRGKVINNCIRCPYHGWSFDRQGICVHVPQLQPHQAIPASYRVEAYQTAARYGYVWVCLSESPLLPIPEIPEAENAAMRLIPQFDEPWYCSGLRLMENSFDNAHFSFVHQASFGNQADPQPALPQIIPLQSGLQMKAIVPVVNPPVQQKNLNLATANTVRTVESTWHIPFSRTLKITYPNGLIHLIFTAATPVNDRVSHIIQFCVRNDTEAEAKAVDIVAFDRQVTLEDKAVLETTDPDTPLEITAEQHMSSDQPGIMMRRKLAELIRNGGLN